MIWNSGHLRVERSTRATGLTWGRSLEQLGRKAHFIMVQYIPFFRKQQMSSFLKITFILDDIPLENCENFDQVGKHPK